MIPSNAVASFYPLPANSTPPLPTPTLRRPVPSHHIYHNPLQSPLLSLEARWRQRRRLSCAARRGWDSNAERFRFDRGDEKSRWWLDQDYDGDFDELVDDDEPEQPWERIWIFKVFKGYGYLLPAIIASMLLATGPKAFLMALALPLGQSALSLAVDKIWGNARERPRAKGRRNKKPFSNSSSFRKQQQEENSGRNSRKQGYQPWASAKRNVSSRTPFGGWDELDSQEGSSAGSMRKQPFNRSAKIKEEPVTTGKGRLSTKRRQRDAPLLLRLLIAVFPFLGSWTRIFW